MALNQAWQHKNNPVFQQSSEFKGTVLYTQGTGSEQGGRGTKMHLKTKTKKFLMNKHFPSNFKL